MWSGLGFILFPLAQMAPMDPSDSLAEVATQPVIVVEGESPQVRATPRPDDSRLDLERLAGAGSVHELERVREGVAPNLAEGLEAVPGLYARSRNGSAQSRLSIRGSGLARNADTRGIALQLNGLPLNVADADFDFLQAIEPLALSHVRVFRSANTSGGATNGLGGSIDFITRTGRDLPQAEVRTELGSFDTFRQHVSGGWAGEKIDGFASLTHFNADGFREHSQQNRQHATASMSWREPGEWENRVEYTGFQNDEELPGALTAAQIQADRRQFSASANPLFDRVRADWRDETVWHRVADRFVWQGDGQRVEGGAWLTSSSIRNPRNQVFDTDGWDTGGRLKWSHEGEMAGMPHNVSVMGTAGFAGNEETVYTNTGGGHRGAVVDDTSDRFANADLFLQNDLEFAPGWHWVTSLQLGYALRAMDDRVVVPGEDRTTDEKDFYLLNPAMGLVYHPMERIQIYGNIARAQEPPTQADLYRTGSARYFPLEAQKSLTVEVGSRGEQGRLGWDAAFYQSWLEDEYLITENIPGSTDTRNTPESVHRGIEAEMSWEFLERVSEPEGDLLRFVQQVTWNDFYMVDDPQFGDGRLAGIPTWLLRSEVAFRHASGFYVSPDVQIQPEGIDVDYANTLQSDAFVLVGLRAGYGRPQGWQIFFEARNLSDETYVADVTVIADAGGVDRRVFFPGNGRAFYGGMSWRW
jgi:iron complex outermembrane recepter protein